MAAFKAYCAAMNKKLATPADLLSGAMRYAAERSGQDPKYTKHPATWLNSGCWSDEPSAPITSTIDANGNQIRPPPDRRQQAAYGPQLASALAAARRLSEKGGDQ